MNNRYQLEKKLLSQGDKFVIGCDEVGRGPLAGPVVAAAVTFTEDFSNEQWWNEIGDSKILSETKRLRLAEEIKNNSVWSISSVSNNIIDKHNILRATFKAMRACIAKIHKQHQLTVDATTLLIDGKLAIPKMNYKQISVISGDALVHSIAAASIIAKVYRDNLMQRLDAKYPLYGFSQHKGYGTKFHREAIMQHGLSAVHRESFCGNLMK